MQSKCFLYRTRVGWVRELMDDHSDLLSKNTLIQSIILVGQSIRSFSNKSNKIENYCFLGRV